jgi:hypothetical protein
MKTVLFCLLSLSLASAIQQFDIETLRQPASLSTALEQADQHRRMNQGAFQPIQHVTEETQRS